MCTTPSFNISVRVAVLEPCHLSFQASQMTSVSRQGEVLLLGEDRIHVYEYRAITGTFTEMRHLDRPEDISNLYMYDSQDGTVVLQDNTKSTLVISSQGVHPQPDAGLLIGCWSNKRRVYVVGETTEERRICIVDESSTKTYPHPLPEHRWGKYISACEDERTGNKAVCQAVYEKTLDIFNSQGEML